MLPRYPEAGAVGGLRPPNTTEKKPADHDIKNTKEAAYELSKDGTYPAWFEKRYSPEKIRRTEELARKVEETAHRQNNYIKKEYGAKVDLLNRYGAIDARFFAPNQGGKQTKETAQKHKEYVEATERRLADAEMPEGDMTPELFEKEKKAWHNRRTERMKRYGISPHESNENIIEKLVEGFRLERAMSESFQLEKVFVVTFAKLIGPEFIVCRTADFDDYKGADTIIMDTKTGQVICTLDEVFDKFTDNPQKNDLENERVHQKKTTTEKINRQGGHHIEYGVRITQTAGKKKLSREPIDKAPLFYVAIKKSQFDRLLDSYNTDDGNISSASLAEIEFFQNVITSWREQINALPTKKPLPARHGSANRHRLPEPAISSKELLDAFKRMEILKNRFTSPSNT